MILSSIIPVPPPPGVRRRHDAHRHGAVSPMMVMMVMMVVVIMMIVVMIMVVMVVVVVEIDLIIEPNAIVETRTDPNHVIVTPARFDENCPFFEVGCLVGPSVAWNHPCLRRRKKEGPKREPMGKST